MDDITDLSFSGISLAAAISIATALVVAFVVHWLLFAAAMRVARRTSGFGDGTILRAIRRPSRWLILLFALGAAIEPLTLGPRIAVMWQIGSKMIFALLLGWLTLSLLRAIRHLVDVSSDISVEDNLKARRRRTRMSILYRIAQVVVGVIVVALMLIAIPGVRSIGVTLMVSAGLAALAVGAAAQPALKTLIAGIQMAFTEPIRLDDVVIVEGEWGRIEEIYLTYVVVRIWDDRRMVVPTTYFLEKPFQNWTTRTSDLLGTVFFYVDPTADIARIRAHFIAATKANQRWDGRVAILQVSEHKPDALELRGLLSARNAGVAFDLRCEVREAVMDFLRVEMPEALVRGRQRIEGEMLTRPSGVGA